ncbi:hypothetical protein HanIR_Chr13g0655401 [Helianthus annuus]|nr:hypothetical protein HanIR_Chr13g0655401 [Helianthus annuus]
MNSIFSSFDVLSAEFLGQSVSYFNNKQPATTNLVDQKKVKPEAHGNATRPRSTGGYPARWAPEFDGLNCFESLVFH